MSFCVAYGCKNKFKKKIPGITFHRFPKDEELRFSWIIAVRRKNWIPSNSSRLCSAHFPEHMIDRTSLSCVRLRENAVPTLFQVPSSYLKKNSKNTESSTKCCFVNGCATGLHTYGKGEKAEKGQKTLNLFYPPRDSVLFEKWKKVIPEGHRELTSSDRICELHFSEDDIVRHYGIKLPDGTVNEMESKTVVLKQGAVPHFSELPECLTEEVTRMKQLLIPNSDDATMPISTENLENCNEENETSIILNLRNETNNILNLRNEMNNILHVQKESLAKIFKIAVEAIKVPSPWWGINSTPEFIICTKWNDSFSPEKRVVIGQDLNAKVFIKDYEMQTDEILSVFTVEDISCLLQQIDYYEICAGAEDKSMINCKRFMLRTTNGRYSSWCDTCKIALRKRHKVILQRKRREIKKFRKMQCFACAVEKTCPETQSEDTSFSSTDEHSIDTVVVAECLISEDNCK